MYFIFVFVYYLKNSKEGDGLFAPLLRVSLTATAKNPVSYYKYDVTNRINCEFPLK